MTRSLSSVTSRRPWLNSNSPLAGLLKRRSLRSYRLYAVSRIDVERVIMNSLSVRLLYASSEAANITAAMESVVTSASQAPVSAVGTNCCTRLMTPGLKKYRSRTPITLRYRKILEMT